MDKAIGQPDRGFMFRTAKQIKSDAQRWSELSYGNQQKTKAVKDSIKVLKNIM